MKIIYLTLILLSINIRAQIDFNEQFVFESTSTKNAISVDIDNDGDLDIISVSVFLFWNENLDGNGRFSESKYIAYVGNGSNIDIADIDNDGDMDVFVFKNSKLSWFENLNGYFSTEKIITNDIFLVSKIFFLDMDNDGDLDVISNSKEINDSSASLITWYENIDGFGNFEGQYIITSFGHIHDPVEIYFNDYNGDTNIDLLISGTTENNYNVVYWLENNNGNFEIKHNVNYYVDRIQDTGDINGDGFIDLLGFYSGHNQWFENDGLGNFNIHFFSEDFSTNTINLIDLDNDNDLDIVYSDNSRKEIRWWKNSDGQGDFILMQPFYNIESFYWLSINEMNFGDINNDSKLDIITSSSHRTSWLKNIDDTGNFSSDNLLNQNVEKLNTLVAADIDGDGDNDIISEYHFVDSGNASRLVMYKNNGNGYVGEENIIDEGTKGITSIKTGDIDNDGDLDIFVSVMDVLSSNLSWYENINGQGEFSEKKIIASHNSIKGANSIFLADIDGDDDLDVIASSSYYQDNHKVVWYENTNGLGDFGNQQLILSDTDEMYTVIVADIDGDNDMDIISGASGPFYNGLGTTWCENIDGNGTFSSPQTISSSASDSICAVDIDNDGDIDIATSYLNDDRIVWYENTNGLGLFQQREGMFDLNGPTSIVSYDIDGDGDNDLIASSKYDDKISWYENLDGLGDFGSNQIVGKVNSATVVYAADMNGDGKKDIISGGNKSLSWFENLGFVEGNEINGFIRVDMNDDGCSDLDPVISNLLIVNNNGTRNTATFTQSNGFYQFFTNEGTYTTTPSIPEYYTSDPSFSTTNFTSVGNTEILNFCMVPNEILNDLNISIYPLNVARPGFNASYQIIYSNIGTTQLNGNITFDFDDIKLSFIESSEVISSQTSNSLTFDYSNLKPFETRTIDLYFNVAAPPITEIDNILNFTTTIYPISGDYTTDDNNFELNQTVIGSYDPNDITCLEGNQVLYLDKDKYLHYIIRFQNTGSANAINVIVKNNLDPYLDWSTLQLMNISHPNKVVIKEGRELSFIFNNIDLPDSNSDELNSHGFITYKIKAKSEISIGDIILNKADIFFDFNDVIETNIISTEIIGNLSPNANCQNINAYLDIDGNISITPSQIDNGSTDDVEIALYTLSQTAFDCGNLGVNDVTLTVTDEETGVSDNCTAIVTIIDNLKPTAIGQNIQVDLLGNASVSITTSAINNGSSDNCGITSMSISQDTFTTIGNYTIDFTVTDSSSNSDTTSVNVEVIDSKHEVKGLEIYPNPTTGQVSIKAHEQIENIIVLDIWGKNVMNISPRKPEVNLNLNNLSKGIYLIKIMTKTGMSINKLLLK